MNYPTAHNKRVRMTNLAMCGATNIDATLDQQVESFKIALAIWPKGSYEYQNVVKQCPHLAAIIVIENAYKSSKESA